MSVATFQNFVSIETEGGNMHKPELAENHEALIKKGRKLRGELRMAQVRLEKAQGRVLVLTGRIEEFQKKCPHPRDQIETEVFNDGPGLKSKPICQVCGAEVRRSYIM